MEFFSEIDNVTINCKQLKEQLSIAHLPALCSSIDNIISDNIDNGSIYCLWGEFRINREELDHGIRFTLPGCPNSLAWSITLDDEHREITIHCTINKKTHEADFIESIEHFLNDWHEGLERLCTA